MKFNAFALAFAAVGCASAQTVTWVSPTAGQTLVAGEPFTATVQFGDSLSNVDVVAVVFGLNSDLNDPEPTVLGETRLGTVLEPTFVFGPGIGLINSTTLTIPTDLFSGLNQNYTLTLGEFFLIGDEMALETFINGVEVFVSS